MSIRKVKVKDIRSNPFQPRKNIDAETISSLADDIKKVGLWTGALRGRENNGHVELCFGHRRLEAVKHLGWKEVDVDVVKLSDEDMSLQSLIENLQREGLNDADRGDGIASYIKLKTGISDLSIMSGHNRRTKEDQNAYAFCSSVRDELAELLGLKPTRMAELLRISQWDEKSKEPIREQKIAGRAAVIAKQIGGDAAIGTAAKNDISTGTMQAISSKFAELPEETEQDKKVKEKVRESFAKGKIKTAEEVVKTARQVKGQTTRKPDVPPDLIDVMREWTERARRWAEQLEEVSPYIDYIDSEPKVAERWREVAKLLIEKLQKFA